MEKIINKRFVIVLFILTILLSAKISLAADNGWCDWIGNSAAYNESCPEDCRNMNNETKCLAVVATGNGVKCCKWSPINNGESPTQGLTGQISNAVGLTAKPKTTPIKFIPSVGLPGFPKGVAFSFSENSTSPIAKLMMEVYKYGVQIIIVLALIVIMLGGFLWSIAGGSQQKVGEAKQWLGAGLIGASLIIFAYLILKTINVNLVNLRTSNIQAVSGKNLKIPTNKSDPEQVYNDCSQFDKTYANANALISNIYMPQKEACCMVYNYNPDLWKVFGADRNSWRAASYNYSPDLINNVRSECISYAIGLLAESKKDNLQAISNGTFTQTRPKSHLGNIRLNEVGLNRFVYTQAAYVIDDLTGNSNFSSPKIEDFNNEDFEKFSTYKTGTMMSRGADISVFLIEDKACWNLGSWIKSNAQGKDSLDYCVDKNNYDACMLKIPNNPNKRLWGYCFNNVCQECKKYGEDSDNAKKCPNPEDETQGNNGCMTNLKCGNDVSGDVDNGFCQCNTSGCMNACKNQMQGQDASRIKDVCEAGWNNN